MRMRAANKKDTGDNLYNDSISLSEDISAKRKSTNVEDPYATYGEEELRQYTLELSYPIFATLLLGVRYNQHLGRNATKSEGSKHKLSKYIQMFGEPRIPDIVNYKAALIPIDDGYAIEDIEDLILETKYYKIYGDREILIGAKALKYLIDTTDYVKREKALIEEIFKIGGYIKNIELSAEPKENYVKYTQYWYGPNFTTVHIWGNQTDFIEVQNVYQLYMTKMKQAPIEEALYKILYDKKFESSSKLGLNHRKEALRILQNATKDTLDMLIIEKMITPVKNLYSTEKGSAPHSNYKLIEKVKHVNDFQQISEKMLEDPTKFKQFVDDIQRLQKSYDLMLFEEFENGNKNKGEGLVEYMMGKEGLIRNEILGKNIICSARAVIHPCPIIAIDEILVPYEMLRDLYSYHIFVNDGLNVKTKDPKKQEQIRERVEFYRNTIPIMVGRQPTLHILSKLAFKPVIDYDNPTSKSVGMSNWVTDGFNADFDGDQVVLICPITPMACEELRTKAMPTDTLLRPRDSKLFVMIKQEAIYGVYYLTKRSADNSHKLLYSVSDCISDNEKFADQMFKGIYAPCNGTTIGRAIIHKLFQELINYLLISDEQMVQYKLDEDMEKLLNEPSTNNSLIKMLTKIFAVEGISYKTKSNIYPRFVRSMAKIGLTVAKIFPPTIDVEYFDEIETQTIELTKNIDLVNKGLITHDEFNIFSIKSEEDKINRAIEDKMINSDYEYGIVDQVQSGARGKMNNINLMYGIKGSINIQQTNTTMYISSNYLKGLNTIEHCMSSQGTTSQVMLKTLEPANTGYGMRKMVHTAIETVIREDDCGTADATKIDPLDLMNILGVTIDELPDVIFNIIHKRYNQEGILITYDIAMTYAMMMTEATRELIENGVDNPDWRILYIRTLSTCKSTCAKCYGKSMVNNEDPYIGEAIGVIAATSLGEIGTQSTMKVFQTGGKSSNMSSQKAIEKTLSIKDIRDRSGVKRTLVPIAGTLKVSEKGRLIIVPDNTQANIVDLDINVSNMTEKQIRQTFAPNRHVDKNDVIGLTEDFEVFIDEIRELKDIQKAKWLMVLKLYAYFRSEDANIKHLEAIVESILSYKIVASNDKHYSIGYYIDKGLKIQLNEDEVKVMPEFVPYTDRETKDNSPLSGLAYQRIKDSTERFIETPYLNIYKQYDKRLLGRV